MRTYLIGVLLLLVTSGCSSSSSGSSGSGSGPDPHSYANYDAVLVRDLKLDLVVSFEQRTLAGTAELTLMWRKAGPRQLVLDTRDLGIERVSAVESDGSTPPLPFTVGPRDPIFGSKLVIQVKPGHLPERVRIEYKTSPSASGLQWLSPAQTAGKQHPFLFSQSQAIHARSWVPIQDTPAVRFTYSARVRTPPGLLARMSADNRPPAQAAAAGPAGPAARADEPRDGDYRFTMTQPIPSYLLAIAVGDLRFAALSERAGVYAEPPVLERAAAEFADTEAMIAATERLYGPYRWGRYDLLVLPPSFPLGGMENPRLTFVTPTVIAGDKSLVSLIAHELAHSWSGNLVTNDCWNSFWLNEGFTSYVENRIVEAVYGRERAVMEQELSQDGLREELKELSIADQRLRLDLRGRDPDRGMTAVPYDKGHWFLRFLEQRFGREVFDAFLRRYFDRFAFQSIGTDDFATWLEAELIAKHPGKVTREEIHAWLEEPSVPACAQASISPRFAEVDRALKGFEKAELEAEQLPAEGWSPQEWLRFLNGLVEGSGSIPHGRLAALDQRWKLTTSGNSEIAHAWFRVCLRTGYTSPAVDGALDRYLIEIGRRKLIVPLYEELLKSPAGRERALSVYSRARAGYHPIVQGTLDGLVK